MATRPLRFVLEKEGHAICPEISFSAFKRLRSAPAGRDLVEEIEHFIGDLIRERDGEQQQQQQPCNPTKVCRALFETARLVFDHHQQRVSSDGKMSYLHNAVDSVTRDRMQYRLQSIFSPAVESTPGVDASPLWAHILPPPQNVLTPDNGHLDIVLLQTPLPPYVEYVAPLWTQLMLALCEVDTMEGNDDVLLGLARFRDLKAMVRHDAICQHIQFGIDLNEGFLHLAH